MFSGIYVFEASQVYQCLTSVPFNDAVALRFVDYYNETMQFHSTLAYLKDPPEGYQQPSVDLVDALAVIKQNITAGYYKNQYAFEAEVQKLVYSVHDMHVDLWAEFSLPSHSAVSTKLSPSPKTEKSFLSYILLVSLSKSVSLV